MSILTIQLSTDDTDQPWDLLTPELAVLQNGLDLGQEDPATGRRVITLSLRVGLPTSSADDVLTTLADLGALITDPVGRRLTLTLGGDGLPTTRRRVWDAELEISPQALQTGLRGTALGAVLTLTTDAAGVTDPVELVPATVIDSSNPIIVVPPAGGDQPADLSLSIIDMAPMGEAINRWRIAGMPLAGDDPPALTASFTDPTTADPTSGTLDGNAPAQAVVGPDWTTIGQTVVSWPDGDAPAQAVLLTRLADAGSVAGLVQDVRARADDGPLAAAQAGEVRDATASFGPIAAGTLLVVGVQARASAAFSWPGGWTSQAAVQSGSHRLEVRTQLITTDTNGLSVAVGIGSGSEAITTWFAIAGAASVTNVQTTSVATIKKGGQVPAPTVVTLPGTGYHATVTIFGSEPSTRVSVGSAASMEDPVFAVTAPQAVWSAPAARGAAGARHGVARVLSGSDGQMTFDPMLSMAGAGTFRSTDPRSVTLTISTAATAPNVPRSRYTTGITTVGADGIESPLAPAEVVNASGIQTIRGSWSWRRSPIGVTAVRWWWKPDGGTWRYLTVSPGDTTVTLTTVTDGTAAQPPILTPPTQLLTRAVLSAGPDAASTVTLPAVPSQVGASQWELVAHGLTPLPLVPGRPASLAIRIEGRATAGSRRVWLDRVMLLPASPDGSAVTTETPQSVPVPLAWSIDRPEAGTTATTAIDGNTTGIVPAPTMAMMPPGIDQTGTDDARLWVMPAVRNIEPSAAFDWRAPAWTVGIPESTSFAPTALATTDAGANAYLASSPVVAVLTSGSSQGYGPSVRVTAGTTYTGQVAVRLAPSEPAASAHVQLRWQDGSGNTTVGTAANGPATALSSAWQLLTVTGQAPTGAVSARLSVVRDSGTGVVWIDAPMLAAGTNGPLPVMVQTAQDDNLLVNGGLTGGSWGWWLDAAASWAEGQVSNLNNAQFLISAPVRVAAGDSVTFSVSVSALASSAIIDILWSGGTTSSSSGLPSGRQSLTATAPAGTTWARARVRSTASGAFVTASQLRLTTDGATTWVAPDPGTETAGSALQLGTMADPAADRGWVVIRLAVSANTATAPILDRRIDGNNRLTLSASRPIGGNATIQLTRMAGGAGQTVSVTPTAGPDTEMVIVAAWTPTELRLRVHNGANWGTVQTVSSTAQPSLSGRPWTLGTDGTTWLMGRIAWVAAGTEPDSLDPTPAGLFDGGNIRPLTIPPAAGPAWTWSAALPGFVRIAGVGGWATTSGRLQAAPDRSTALVLVPEQADGSHRPWSATVTVTAAPRRQGIG